jgi:DNA-3-methyladenine glycosylase II
MGHFLIDVEGLFNADYSQRYFCRVPGEIIDLFQNGKYMRVLSFEDKLALVSVRFLGETVNPRLEVSCENLNQENMKMIEQKLRRVFNLNLDLQKFYEFAVKDEILAPIAAEIYGYRPPCFPSLFEALVCTIVGQQVNVRFALDVKSRIVRRYSQALTLNGKTYYGFPTPEVIQSATVTEMRKLRVSRQKTRYITGVASLFLEGTLDEEKVSKMKDEEALSFLMRIKGIGRWSAEYVLIRGFGRTGVVPAVGTGVRAAFSYFFKKERLAEDEVRTLAERWKDYKGLAAFYLRFAYYKRKTNDG